MTADEIAEACAKQTYTPIDPECTPEPTTTTTSTPTPAPAQPNLANSGDPSSSIVLAAAVLLAALGGLMKARATR